MRQPLLAKGIGCGDRIQAQLKESFGSEAAVWTSGVRPGKTENYPRGFRKPSKYDFKIMTKPTYTKVKLCHAFRGRF